MCLVQHRFLAKIMPERWRHMFCASCFLFGEQVARSNFSKTLYVGPFVPSFGFGSHLLIRKRVTIWCNFSKFVARHAKFSWHINQLIAVENYLTVPNRQNKTKSVKFHLNCMHLFERFLYKLVTNFD
jgi:hypothetical protein